MSLFVHYMHVNCALLHNRYTNVKFIDAYKSRFGMINAVIYVE